MRHFKILIVQSGTDLETPPWTAQSTAPWQIGTFCRFLTKNIYIVIALDEGSGAHVSDYSTNVHSKGYGYPFRSSGVGH